MRTRGLLGTDEAKHESLVEAVTESVLEPACALLPLLRRFEPVRSVRDVGPRPDGGDPSDETLDVGADASFELTDPALYPVVAHAPTVRELDEELFEEVDVDLEHELAKVGDGAHVPEEAHAVFTAHAPKHGVSAGEVGEAGSVLRA